MEAQSSNKPGMLHPRYNNYLACLYNIQKEEGFKGFYKGFAPYAVAQAITLMVVPFIAEELLKRSNLYGREKFDQNDQLFDEIAEGRRRI